MAMKSYSSSISSSSRSNTYKNQIITYFGIFSTFKAENAITFVFPVRLNKWHESLKTFLVKHPTDRNIHKLIQWLSSMTDKNI